MKARALLLVPILLFCRQQEFSLAAPQPNGGRPTIALPDPALMKCANQELWQGEAKASFSIYPERLMMDHFDQSGCPRGMIVLYDKEVSFSAIKAAINERYGKWEQTDLARPTISIWRVEPERFAIQLTTIGKSRKETAITGGEEMRQVIYLSIPAKKAPMDEQPHPQIR